MSTVVAYIGNKASTGCICSEAPLFVAGGYFLIKMSI
jgi:hypothetical protein